ncbi:MAG: polymorphic toxin-type HINT domain-containing protein [Candidatus Kerfeldbacteria bacterium]
MSGTSNEDFVYFKGMTGIFDIISSNKSNFSFEFDETYAPNIYVYGIYFDGRSYHLTESLRLDYDTTIQKLNIDIDQDKINYGPGEEVNLEITVTDINDNPVKAEVNVSAIDEALTALQWNNDASFFSTLYTTLPLTLEYSYQSHKDLAAPMAEGGGCFTGDTNILMSDGSSKQISDVRIGDEVLTKIDDESNDLVTAKVLNTVKHLVNGYLIINEDLQVTDKHIIYLNGEWSIAGDAKEGDYLTNSSGEEVIINSIIETKKPSKVYNLHIENLNTFIADDIYVHNSKGGLREDFQDIAFFGSVETNGQGQATLSFELPDNITSWATTVHALTKDLKAESTQSAVIATLPFFVDVAVAENYIVGDKPVVNIRSFGIELDTDAQVEYTISYPGYNEDEIVMTANASEAVEITLPEFGAGEFSIQVIAKQGNYNDAVKKSFDFYQSNLLEGNSTFYDLIQGVDITGSEDSYTNLTFTNKERGQYYNLLKRSMWSYGDRVEQKVSRYYADKLLMDYFDEPMTGDNDFDFTAFQQSDGGISLLPYSSSDILLTAKVMEVAGSKFDAISAKSYFEAILANKDNNLDEIVYALLGMSNIGEPVLTEINILMDSNEIPDILKLYLSRALSNLGATEYATTLVQTILDNYGDETDNYIKLALGEDQDEYTEYTYQAAIVLAQASTDIASKLFDYAYANPAKEQLNNLEQLAYVQYALPLLSGDPVSFSYILNGKTESVSLANNEKLSLLLTSTELGDIAYSNIVGAVGMVSSYQVPVDLANVEVDPDISVTREYTVDGTSTVNFQENDVVKITLSPNISDGAIDNEYQLTDYLPSGLKMLSNLHAWSIGWTSDTRYPYEIDGQAVKFWTSRTTEPFHYYAIVISKGDYIAEQTILQGFVAKDSINYGVQSAINIQ